MHNFPVLLSLLYHIIIIVQSFIAAHCAYVRGPDKMCKVAALAGNKACSNALRPTSASLPPPLPIYEARRDAGNPDRGKIQRPPAALPALPIARTTDNEPPLMRLLVASGIERCGATPSSKDTADGMLSILHGPGDFLMTV